MADPATYGMQDSEVPTPGQQALTPGAFIHRAFDGVEKIFLPKRAATKKFLPDVYELPGGHVDFGENIVAGLKREIFEELGMRVNIGDPFAAFDYMNGIKGSHSIEIVYFATFEGPIENLRLNPEDHSEFKWVAEDEVDGLFTGVKTQVDWEVQAIKKGFALLRGERLLF